MKTGAKILIESLLHEGVDAIFGYPGGTVLPIYDELYDSSLRHILVRHEQAAVHAADGYARASGRVGVCLATSGPGACNLVTGIATAYMDSVPVVAITGQVPTTLLGNDAFQESDITGITLPITKHSYLVNNAGELGKIVHEAFYIAGTGRMGPVLIDIPKDVQTDVVADPETVPEKVSIRGYQPTVRGHPKQIEKAVSMISGASRPVIYAGGGVIASGGDAELMRFAETMMIPVTTTLMGLGAIPAHHPLNLGMLGMHGTQSANYAVTECDLLIAVGARFDDRVTGKLESFAPNAQVIHIDIDPAEIGKNKAVDLPIVGDVRQVLKEINLKLTEKRVQSPWNDRLAEWKSQSIQPPAVDTGLLTPQYIVRTLSDLLTDSGIIVTEVGQNQMWAAQHYSFTRPRQWITSGGLGTMGYGFPAAIGASIACPDKTVVDIAGDGSFQMNIQELATVVQYNIPVKIMILNNQYLGMVRQWQELFYDRRYSYTELPSVDFVGIAKAYGVPGICVTDPADVKDALRQSLTCDGPFLLDFRIEREENVMPMVPAGAAINEMILGDKR
ncbi:biosynthetic-type acetolactate synthase large subunit [Methanogenium sp. S4BF]|uniref:biosynthetic-type acetolactate synthase large subunit n=1 Tax=Methanogenium sp. S4BF TaxID=1789226 RepID=UPI0024176749|nr:biosynthetic-type acetolactate synthase large subunit [Methanogenium sp. S4BF]WFN35139.1 biosynthetic-type acetolactate synthase large subunit [Methanogenium sp. S4BF]